eukprot:106216-Amphidinium_carterae.1
MIKTLSADTTTTTVVKCLFSSCGEVWELSSINSHLLLQVLASSNLAGNGKSLMCFVPIPTLLVLWCLLQGVRI